MACPLFTEAAGTIIVAIIILRAEPITEQAPMGALASALLAATIPIAVAPLPGTGNPPLLNKMCVAKYNAVAAELAVETRVLLRVIVVALAVADVVLVAENN